MRICSAIKKKHEKNIQHLHMNMFESSFNCKSFFLMSLQTSCSINNFIFWHRNLIRKDKNCTFTERILRLICNMSVMLPSDVNHVITSSNNNSRRKFDREKHHIWLSLSLHDSQEHASSKYVFHIKLKWEGKKMKTRTIHKQLLMKWKPEAVSFFFTFCFRISSIEFLIVSWSNEMRV